MALLLFTALWGTQALAAPMPTFSSTASGTTSNLTLIANLSIGDADVGRNGNVYLAAYTGSAWYVHNGTDWVSWSGGSMPVYSVERQSNRNIDVVRNIDASALIGTEIYIGYGLSESDMLTNGKYDLVYTVTAEIDNVAPVANPSVTQNVSIGSLVTLNGSASSDANGNQLTYNWTLTSKPTSSIATLTNSTSPLATFTADLAGTYVARLIVNDGMLNSDAATVTVTATAAVSAADNAGKLTTRIDESSNANGIAVQPDGKIVLVGRSSGLGGQPLNFTLARYNRDGSLDTTFSGDGIVTTNIAGRIGSNDWLIDVALQSDGKIVAVGYSVTWGDDAYKLTLVRYNPDGSLDTSFSGTGIVTTHGGSRNLMGQSITLQADGKILVAGLANGTNRYTSGYVTLLARYNSDGSLDTSFADNGIRIDGTTDGIRGPFALQPDGKILVASSRDNGNGSAFALIRYNEDGSLDTSFSGNGIVTTEIGSEVGSRDYGDSVFLQLDGKILVLGKSYSPSTGQDFALVRYNSDGSLDTSFSSGGKLTTNFGWLSFTAYSIAIQPDGKILAAGEGLGLGLGSSIDFALVRLNSDGSLDVSFADDGKQMTDFRLGSDIGNAIALQVDGEILVAGSSFTYSAEDNTGGYHSFALARYTPDGSMDLTFNTTQPVLP